MPVDLTSMAVEVAVRFEAPIETVWELLTDVQRMAGLGPEHVRARWLTPAPEGGAPDSWDRTAIGHQRVGCHLCGDRVPAAPIPSSGTWAKGRSPHRRGPTSFTGGEDAPRRWSPSASDTDRAVSGCTRRRWSATPGGADQIVAGPLGHAPNQHGADPGRRRRGWSESRAVGQALPDPARRVSSLRDTRQLPSALMVGDSLWEQHASWWQEEFTDGVDPEYEEQILPLIEHASTGRGESWMSDVAKDRSAAESQASAPKSSGSIRRRHRSRRL